MIRARDHAAARAAHLAIASRVLDTIEAVHAGSARLPRCMVCHRGLGTYGEDYKRAALVGELPLTAISPNERALHACARERVARGAGTAIALDLHETR
jgi:hypothetical protein